MTMTDDTHAPPPISASLAGYRPRSEIYRKKLIEPVFSWLETSRKRDRFEVAKIEMEERVKRLEDSILAYFAEFAGGPDHIHKNEAWRLACRQREFVRECCARMVEGPDGEPTSASEAIRGIDIGEHVKVIPDYSRSEA
ncbi:hypothetical protein [Rhizobium phaseoli]|uniref:hypothetical protein n=1 Tax=Rhizobium phaseoli TaxID=396 RepID=UPI000BE7E269|nr:hypothetical protein [Rhizobium phaseoli]PDS68914.1 hypothetical protein CO651_26375 [Rhizobium phaseoli]